MNAWSRRRKRIISLIIFVALVVLVGLPTYFLWYEAPTCFDGKQNGSETGVDCGGECQLLCTAESIPLIVKGDPRIIEVAPDIFEVVVLVDNPNPNAEIYRAGYSIQLFGATSTLPIKTIDGSAFIPRSATIAVFEGPFTIESAMMPTRATFEWKEAGIIWRRAEMGVPELNLTNLTLTRASTTPRIDALIENSSLESVSNIDLTALVYNQSGTIFAASKTFVDLLVPGQNVPVVFSWPRAFEDTAYDMEVLIRVLPDRSFVR